MAQPKEVELKNIEWLRRKRALCYVIRVEGKEVNANKEQEVRTKAEIDRILERHVTVLEEPHGLPPKRIFDHHIPLKDETRPINMHPYPYPYRYAHFQKEEIERQVRGLVQVLFRHPFYW